MTWPPGRRNSNGTPDTSVGNGGVVVHNGAAGENGIYEGLSVTTGSAGRILVAGRSRNSAGSFDMVIWRYIP